MHRRVFISLGWLRLAAQTRLANSQLPTDPQFHSIETTDPNHSGYVALYQKPGTAINVAPNAVTISAPLSVPAGYTLVFPSVPPAAGQTTIGWSQPDPNGVVVGSWQ